MICDILYWMLKANRFYRIHSEVFRKHRILSLLISVAMYASVMLFLSPYLKIASNYFVILPIISAALGFGLWGGMISGTLGLGANMLLYSLIGHPEFSPTGPVVAQFSGILIGLALGGLSDYFQLLTNELETSEKLLNQLNQKIEDKEILIQEIHHRVKNNLTLILSLLQLQSNRSNSREFDMALESLTDRIKAIASIHDYIYTHETRASVDLTRHIPELCSRIISSYDIRGMDYTIRIDIQTGLKLQHATALSLILLEIVSNSCKHAFNSIDLKPEIQIKGWEEENGIKILISDNGRGESGNDEGNSVPKSGLGNKIISALAKQIRAAVELDTTNGYHYTLSLPRQQSQG